MQKKERDRETKGETTRKRRKGRCVCVCLGGGGGAVWKINHLKSHFTASPAFQTKKKNKLKNESQGLFIS